MKSAPSTEDRIWAVIAHLSALATGMGLPLPIVGWAEQRRKSNYASFQCLQALGYQSLGYTVWLLTTLLIAVLVAIGFVIFISASGDDPERMGGVSVFMAASVAALVLGLLILYFSLPIIAAVGCALGRDFRYPFMGNRLARYLEYESENEGWLNEEHEDRWVAAMGHFSVIIALWGMLAPLTAWILRGKQSAWLKLQSVQTLLFQAVVVILSMAAGAVYFFGFIVFVLLVGFGENAAMDSSGGIAGLAVLIVSMSIAALIMLIVPLFHIMGQWAGYRVLKGDDYRYPVLGKLIVKRIGGNAAEDGGLSESRRERS